MDSTIGQQHAENAPQSLRVAWQYGKQAWNASSRSDAWASLTKMIEAAPVWALIVFVACVIALLGNAWVLFIPLAGLAFLMATFLTVKSAMRSALRERDTRHEG